MDKSVNTNAAYVCAFCETKSLCKNAKRDAYTRFFGAQTVTISVATAGDFHKIWGFPVSSGVQGFLVKI